MRRLLSVLGLFWCGLACASLPRDSLARLDYTALVNHWGHVLDGYGYGYDFLGLRTNITRDLGLTNSSVAVGYDSVGQLTSWQAREGLTNAVRLNEQNGWAYDAAGNLRYRTNGGLIQTFATDLLNQLTNVTRNSTMTVSGATPAPASSVTVNGQPAQTYGDFTLARTNVTLTNGNNIFSIAAHSPTGTNTTNNLTVNLPGAVTLLYDANGNLTNDGTRSFAYSAENQLTNVTVSGVSRSDFVYDGLGRRRIAREYTNSSGTWMLKSETRLVYDGWLPMQERDANNNVLVTYTRGLDLSGSLQGAGGIGGLLARTDGSGNTFYHADGAGNITAIMDAQQNVVTRYMYGPFGKLTGKWGPLANANVMEFSSMPVHRQSGLSLYPFRAYDPSLQRWLNRDPVGEAGGLNLYGFVGNSPINNVDPYGLWYLLYAPSWFDEQGYQGSNWKEFSEAYIPFQRSLDRAIEGMWRGDADLTQQAFLDVANEAMLAALTAGIAERFPGYLNQAKSWLSKKCSAAEGAGSEVTALTKFYPGDNGVARATERTFLMPGQTIDRYGGSGYSRFFSPQGTPDWARFLPPGTAGQPLRTFEVVKPFEVESGTVAPWFNQPGGGLQYRTPVNLDTLLNRGIIKGVTP